MVCRRIQVLAVLSVRVMRIRRGRWGRGPLRVCVCVMLMLLELVRSGLIHRRRRLLLVLLLLLLLLLAILSRCIRPRISPSRQWPIKVLLLLLQMPIRHRRRTACMSRCRSIGKVLPLPLLRVPIARRDGRCLSSAVVHTGAGAGARAKSGRVRVHRVWIVVWCVRVRMRVGMGMHLMWVRWRSHVLGVLMRVGLVIQVCLRMRMRVRMRMPVRVRRMWMRVAFPTTLLLFLLHLPMSPAHPALPSTFPTRTCIPCPWPTRCSSCCISPSHALAPIRRISSHHNIRRPFPLDPIIMPRPLHRILGHFDNLAPPPLFPARSVGQRRVDGRERL